MTTKSENEIEIEVKIADSPELIEAAQRVRYKVFYDEYGAQPTSTMEKQKLDVDKYDVMTDHLIVIDHSEKENHGVVGTYRMLRADKLATNHDFYTASEYDIHKLKESGADLLELGRSCVLPAYRTRPVLQLLWQGIANYLAEHKIDLMFGCASFNGTDISKIEKELSYLYHYHLATDSLRARALDDLYVDMNILKRIFTSLPPLIKGYLRVGASIGDGAIIDRQFNTVDVCIIMPTHLVTERYLKHYQRKTQGQISTASQFAREMRANDQN